MTIEASTHNRRSVRLSDEDRLDTNEERVLDMFIEQHTVDNMQELIEKTGKPEMGPMAAHAAVCNLVIKGYVTFSAEGYRLISG